MRYGVAIPHANRFASGSALDRMFFRPAHASVSIVLAANSVRALRSLNDVHHLEADALVSH